MKVVRSSAVFTFVCNCDAAMNAAKVSTDQANVLMGAVAQAIATAKPVREFCRAKSNRQCRCRHYALSGSYYCRFHGGLIPHIPARITVPAASESTRADVIRTIETNVLITHVCQIIKKHVTDKDALKAISKDLAELISPK